MFNWIKKKSPNLFPYIKFQAELLEKELLKYSDLELSEKYPHWWKSKKDKFTLTVYWGKPIWCKEGVYIWHKFVIRGTQPEENLNKILKYLKLQPFKDAIHFPNGFHKNTKTRTVSCYINPDFPNGYWQKENKNNYFE